MERAKALPTFTITYSFMQVNMNDIVIVIVAVAAGYVARIVYVKWRDRNAKR